MKTYGQPANARSVTMYKKIEKMLYNNKGNVRSSFSGFNEFTE